VPCAQWINRQSIRKLKNIEPDPAMDMVAVLCCTCCVAGQHALELEARR
jgi:hypothetical protein